MSLVLVIIGVLLLLVCAAGIGLGAYMASDSNTREPGVLFALSWLSGAGGASGIVMRDGVAFSIRSLCFLVAGMVFLFFGAGRRTPVSRGGRAGGTPHAVPVGSEATTKENDKSGYRRAAS